jgi:hypothetical protein
MSNATPGPGEEQLKQLIKDDLFFELKHLLCAATEWEAQELLVDCCPPKMNQPCFHLKVYAMDSAFLHARNLYEFFTVPKQCIERNKKWGRLTWQDFSGDAIQTSDKYDEDFREDFHGRLLHLSGNRSAKKEIKGEVTSLAKDVLQLWDGFAKKPGIEPYAMALNEKRREAIDEAVHVAQQYEVYGFKSSFS